MADQIEAINRALAESTQTAMPIENDVSFEDYIGQMSDDELGILIDSIGTVQGEMGPDTDSEQNYNLLERILQTLGLGRSVDDARLMEGSSPEQIQEYMGERMEDTRGALSGIKNSSMAEDKKMKERGA